MSERHAIVVEKVFPYSPERIWRALTRSELIAKWLMPNDFEPVVGYRFTFKTRPMGDWDGIVHCEVLQCEPPLLLRYSWKGGSRLTRVEGGTHLKMVHDGFVFPGNRLAFDAMAPGWGGVMEAIARVTAETEVSTAGDR
jgi:uncharacterized protein YndB with AHSA1/START domain